MANTRVNRNPIFHDILGFILALPHFDGNSYHPPPYPDFEIPKKSHVRHAASMCHCEQGVVKIPLE